MGSEECQNLPRRVGGEMNFEEEKCVLGKHGEEENRICQGQEEILCGWNSDWDVEQRKID